MLAPTLATRDPYAAATVFHRAGWQHDERVRPAGGEPRAGVRLDRAAVLLVPNGTHPDECLGAGVELHLDLPAGELATTFLLHRAAGVAVSELGPQPERTRGFVAEIVGYRFVISAADPEPDLSLLPADPRIVRLVRALDRAGAGRVEETALALGEASGQTSRRLRSARAHGFSPRSRAAVGVELAEVVIEAAILARQLGVDLEALVDTRLRRVEVAAGRRRAS